MKTMKNIMSIALILLVAMSVFVGCNPVDDTGFKPEDKAQIEEFWGDVIPFLYCSYYEISTGTDSINGEWLEIRFIDNNTFYEGYIITVADMDDYTDKLKAFVGKDAKYTEYAASEYEVWEIITKGNKSIAVRRDPYKKLTGYRVIVRLYNCAVTEIG